MRNGSTGSRCRWWITVGFRSQRTNKLRIVNRIYLSTLLFSNQAKLLRKTMGRTNILVGIGLPELSHSFWFISPDSRKRSSRQGIPVKIEQLDHLKVAKTSQPQQLHQCFMGFSFMPTGCIWLHLVAQHAQFGIPLLPTDMEFWATWLRNDTFTDRRFKWYLKWVPDSNHVGHKNLDLTNCFLIYLLDK